MPEDQNGQEELQAQGEEQQPVEVSTTEEPTEVVQEETQEQDLPEDAKERTREQFEKLKAHNKQLAEEKRRAEEELQRLKGSSQPIPSVLDYLSPVVPQVPQYVPQTPQFVPQMQYPQYSPQVPQQEEQLFDDGGYINQDVLRKELAEAKKAREKAEEAERRARDAESRISKFEQDNETKALYQAYPELDPLSGVFNQEAYEMVRDRLTSQLVQTGKRDAMKAAADMSKYFRKQEPTQAQEQRRQASAPGTTQYRPPATDFDDLKRRSANDPEALFERLKRIGAW